MIVSLPLAVPVSKKKNFLINLNTYRNAHYLTLNRAKITFKEMIQDQLERLPVFHRIRLIYTLFPGSAREMDVCNVCSIADKFFCDALVEAGKLTDDNYKWLPEVEFQIGEIDRTNPRVSVKIEEIPEMQITLNEAEITVAVEDYVRKQISVQEGQDISIDFVAGRGANGLSATLDIVPAGTKATKPTKTTKAAPKAAPEPKPAAKAPAPKPEATEEAEEENVQEEPTVSDDMAAGVEEDAAVEEVQEETAETSAPATKRSIFAKAS